MDDLREILQSLTADYGTVKAAWAAALTKTANSKNITIAEWNSVIEHAGRTSEDLARINIALQSVIEDIGVDALEIPEVYTLVTAVNSLYINLTTFKVEASKTLDALSLTSPYDHVVNTVEGLSTLSSLAGRILVRDIALTNDISIILNEGCIAVHLLNVSVASGKGLTLTGAATLDGTEVVGLATEARCLGACSGVFALIRFRAVSGFHSAMGASVRLSQCYGISDCLIERAVQCYHIDNCFAAPFNPTFIGCHFICGIAFAGGAATAVEFTNCSYLSNIDCEGKYNGCSFVDDTTCKGFVSADDVGKVRAITADGSYLPIVPAQGGGDVPTKISELENDAGYITAEDIPDAPVQSVNGKSGVVSLNANDVGARPDTWTPSASEVGARPSTWMPTYSEVGADKSGSAVTAVSEHNVDPNSHEDIRLLIGGLADRLNALANSDDTTLDQMKEVVDYIKSNRGLIEEITTQKINYTDIVDNLTTNVNNKPLSAAQGVAIKGLIDALSNNKLDASALTNAINTALAQAKESGEFNGEKGDAGVGIKSVVQTTTSTEGGGINVVTVTKTDNTSSTFSVKNGENGTSVTVKSVSESTESGGNNVTTFSDGNTMTVKNGRDGEKGYTPVKGVDYDTPTDRAEIVRAVLESMGAAVYGFVDENNNIVLKGELAEDTYSVKYEMEDGSTVDIGDLSLVVAPTYTNLATKVTEDYRLNSSGAITANNGTDVVEDYIPFAVGDVVRIKGLTLGSTNVAFYNSSKTSIASGAHTYPGHNSSDTITWEKETDTVYKYTNVSNSSCAYIRFGGVLTGATTDVIVTLNEPIE